MIASTMLSPAPQRNGLLHAWLLILGLHACAGQQPGKPQLPHILFVIVDDFGWGNVGYHRSEPTPEVQTPHMDELVREGVELNRHYVHMTCTPSRSSFQSGRLPVHVLQRLAAPCDGNGAIPRNMTGIAAVLKRAGYATHQVGKWDAGMATPYHTPQGRGYDTSLTYFGHANWMYSNAEWLGSYKERPDVPPPGTKDLWDTDRPAKHLNGTGYEEYIFRDRMLQILHAHDQSTPLFLQYDSKLCHYPLQAPPEYQDRYASIDHDNRRVYHAMVSFLDDQLAIITGTMKELGMWDNTLMVLTSDNGGYVKAEQGPCNTTGPDWPGAGVGTDVGHGTACFNGESGASNWPMRGGKYSNFEGGIRVNAFASGGFLPSTVRGKRLDGMVHIADWYRTFTQGIAGLDPTDTWAAASGLPPIDSLDVWPYLSGQVSESPRKDLLVSDKMIIMGQWKFVEGGTRMSMSERGGPTYPNASTADDPIEGHSFQCPAEGCLFDVVRDPTESFEISAANAPVVARLRKELAAQRSTIWKTTHQHDPNCRRAVNELYGGFYGPFREVQWPSTSPFESIEREPAAVLV